jgi:hypothetical protein
MVDNAYMLLLLVCLLSVQAIAAPADTLPENIVLRSSNGRFVGVREDGVLSAAAYLPTERESFELITRADQKIALRQAGHAVVPDAKDARLLRLNAVGAISGDRENFQLVPIEAKRFSLRLPNSNLMPIFRPESLPLDGAKPPAKAVPAEALEVYRLRPLPDLLQTMVSVTVQGLAVKELAGKQYDQTRTEQTKKYIDLPEPTLKDPKHMKRVQVLATSEEYRVQAQVDGNTDIQIPKMLYLRNYAEGGAGAMLVAIRAEVPLTGHVQCKLPNVVTASTGYRATIDFSAVVEVRVDRSGGDVALGPYKVTDMHVSFAKLDLSNDLLRAARHPIKQFINRELRRNEDKIRQSANRALEKAMSSREVRVPMLGYMGL